MPSLRQSLRRLWQRRGAIRDLLRFVTGGRERSLAHRRAAERARFWEAVREGRSEADAQAARREP